MKQDERHHTSDDIFVGIDLATRQHRRRPRCAGLPIGRAHVPQIGLPNLIRPARTRPVDLVVAGERLPHIGPHRLQRPHKLVERSAALLRGEAIGVRQIEGFLRGHVHVCGRRQRRHHAQRAFDPFAALAHQAAAASSPHPATIAIQAPATGVERACDRVSPHGVLDAVPGAQTGGVRRPAAPRSVAASCCLGSSRGGLMRWCVARGGGP